MTETTPTEAPAPGLYQVPELADTARIIASCETCGAPVRSIASSWVGSIRQVTYWAHGDAVVLRPELDGDHMPTGPTLFVITKRRTHTDVMNEIASVFLRAGDTYDRDGLARVLFDTLGVNVR